MTGAPNRSESQELHIPHSVTGVPVHALAMHRDFSCSTCGLCCSTGWNIPIEHAVYERLCELLAEGVIEPPQGVTNFDALFRKGEGLSEDASAWFGQDEKGRCRFLEAEAGNLCAIHRQAGPEVLAMTCRLFPRTCLLQPGGVFVGISHYCPTAGELLFRSDQSLQESLVIERDPPAFPRSERYAGLDAREHVPPLVKPNVPMRWDSFGAWERFAIETLAQEELGPGDALRVLMLVAEELRQFDGPKAMSLEYTAPILGAAGKTSAEDWLARLEAAESGGAAAIRTLTAGLMMCAGEDARLGPLEPVAEAFGALFGTGDDAADIARLTAEHENRLSPAWRDYADPIRRYLASRIFANWYAYQGGGIRSSLLAAAAALGSVQLCATILCLAHDRILDQEILRMAIGQSDYLLLHAHPRQAVIAWLNQAETISLEDLLATVSD